MEDKEYKKYLKIAGNVHLAYYVQAAEKLGIKYEIIYNKYMARFEHNGKHWYIINAVTPLTNSTSTTIAKKKNLTSIILDKAGIPVPEQEGLKSFNDAITFFDKYKKIVIKPSQQLGGIGITLLPQNKLQVVQAYYYAKYKSMSKDDIKVLGEEFVPGQNYRFLVLDNEVIAVVRRKSAHVIGNGKSTIKELIDIENKKRKERILKPILIDNEVNTKLQNDGLSMKYVPKENEEVILRYNCNLTTGGTTEECSKEVNPYYKDIAISSVKALGLKFGGVDMIAEDISNISKEKRFCINEVNYNPGLRLHYKVDKGDIVPVAVSIMEYISKNI